MIRLATASDIAAIAASYHQLLLHEQVHGSCSNWKLGVYPTEQFAREMVTAGMMYVLDETGELHASMVLNQAQADEYAAIDWRYPAEPQQVLVIHTLCIPPESAGHGYGTQMVSFAKQYAREHGCTVLRLDTYAQNEPAKHLYQKSGFRIAGYAGALLQGLIPEELAFLEYQLDV